ncbi:MAG: hypothetical protein C5B51_24965 [Terriglobia bacterium]|nr:MAG: hypothetical protein C5B51_24965 [Terriglobia bacterium]
MRRFSTFVVAILGVMSLSIASAETVNGTGIRRPYGYPIPADNDAARSPKITYHGGPILLGSVPVYIIYYGAFPAITTSIVNDFFSNIGGSPQYNVNTTYFDGQGNHIQNAITFSLATSVYNDNYSQGKNLSGNGVQKVVQVAIQGGHLPADSTGIYFVVTATDVTIAGFCSSFCAYHANSTSIVAGMDIKYSLIPDPTQACAGCDGNVAIYGQNITPNGDLGGDEMTDSIMHELSEAVTDPDGTAWFTRGGAENGDLCNFTYGSTYIAPNGAVANAHLGTRDYLIQEIWENTGKGFCANTLP